MYGTIFRMRVKPGQVERVIELQNGWERDLKPSIDGAIGGLLLKPDNRPDELVGVALFRDRQAYRANLDNPKQDEWYRKMRECLAADPEWEDGEYISSAGLDEVIRRAA